MEISIKPEIICIGRIVECRAEILHKIQEKIVVNLYYRLIKIILIISRMTKIIDLDYITQDLIFRSISL
ncbi:hypothetical protein SteCoe_11100 [Stentor coeruleus]|uniref:Uncharacterized protein n=1 Tax=Stentor coeruleus TaxID=5963 RepID=A0A1R2CE17_9CILI|nr:hypothetical protein SteCoe_11100 [Stentor coeruleus]